MTVSRDRAPLFGLTSVAAMVLFVAGCTAPATPTEATPTETTHNDGSAEAMTGFGDLHMMASEYEAATIELTDSLPRGSQFPPEPPGDWESGGQFEDGVGDVTAALYWRCEWLIAYADARASSDSEAAAEALTALRDWVDLSAVVENSDEDTRSMWLSEIVSPASEGDDTKLLTLAEECASS